MRPPWPGPLVGLKGYVTNIPSRLMGAGEVVSSYHELWHVEQSFRMSKHDLRARPVFHHTHDAIEAHLTVVMAALAVARYLQDTTGISIKRVIRALKPLQEVTINLNGHHLTAADPLPPKPKASSPHSTSQQGTKNYATQVRLVGRCPGAWFTCRWGGGPRSWWCACGASPAPTAVECGGTTPLPWLSPGPG